MKHLYTLLFILLCQAEVFAQLPPACSTPNPPLAKTCSSACILCDLDGYSSATTQTSQGQILPGFCTQVVHSMGYMGFVAGSTDLSIQVDVGACTLGNSIEMGIYQTDDCQDFTLVSDCNTAMFTGNAYFFSNTAPLVPGCPYFLVFDNNGPAACAFTVTVLSGSATAPPVAAPSVPDGPKKVCPGATVTYTITPIDGACHYQWTAPAGAQINGMPSPVTLNHDEGTTVTVTWGSQGGQICVKGMNPCYPGPSACLPVTVGQIPPTILPAISICPGESIEWIDGNFYNSTQLLSTTFVTDIGCDSIVRQQLTVLPPIIKNLGVIRLCSGDCVSVGNGTYCTSGFYQEQLTAANGCDSTVIFSLVIIEANAVIAPADTLTCQLDTVLLDGSGSTAGSLFIWQDSSGKQLSTNDSLLVHQPGWYRLIIERTATGLTCRDTALAYVPGNLQLPSLSAVGDSLSCTDTLGQIMASSTTTGVVFAWTGPGGFQSTLANPMVNMVGVYTVSAAAPNGCVRTDSVAVASNSVLPILSLAAADTLSCLLDTIALNVQSDISGTIFQWTGPQNFSSASANPSVTLPGLYTITATAPNGCTATQSLSVEADTLPPQLSAQGDTLNCLQPSGNLTAIATPPGSGLQWTGPQNFTATVANPQVTIPGVYQVLATGPNGCTSIASAQILADTMAPQLTVSGGTLSCAQSMITLSAILAPAGSSIAWTGPAGFSSNIPNPAVNTAGSYNATATAPNGCTSSAIAMVGADTIPPQLSATGDTITCLQSTGMLNLSISPAGSTVLWAGPQNFSSNQPNPVVSNPGTYTATVTAANGCTATVDAVVVADASIPQVAAFGDTLTCLQNTINLSATVSPPGSSLSWTGPQGFSSSQLNPSAGLPGLYTLTATTANGCTASAVAEVLADTSAPVLSLSGGTISCAQPSISLSALSTPASASIVWSGPQNFSSTQTNPSIILPGSYTAVATLTNGCSTLASVTVPADTVTPLVTALGGTLTCSQTGISLMASVNPGNSTVLWSGPQNFNATQLNPGANIPGLYTFTATAANGCTASTIAEVLIDTMPPFVSAAGGTISCAQPEIFLAAAVTPVSASLVWTGPQNFSSMESSPAVSTGGAYTLLATLPNGCTSSATVQVQTDTIAPQVSAAGGLLTCLQNTLTLTASVAPANSSVLWSGPQNFSSSLLNPSVSTAGTYTIVATAPNGCTAGSSALVTADSGFPTIDVSGGTITCTQPALALNSTVSPAGTSISWTGPQNFSSGQPGPTVTIPGNYILTATTSAGCTATATAIVLIDTLAPQLIVNGGLLSCSQTSTTISAQINPASAQVLWQGPMNFSSALPAPSVSLPGTYTATATGPNGCTASAAVSVNADTTAPQLLAQGGLITCLQSSIQLTLQLTPSNSIVQWSGPQNFSSSQANPFVNQAGVYTVSATAPNGCIATTTATVDADVDIPQVTVNGGTITCTQTVVPLSSSVSPAGGTLAWSGPQNFSSTQPNPGVSAAGSYTLVVSLPNGCTASASAMVDEDTAPPEVDASGNDITCREETAYLAAEVTPAGCTLLWSGPQNFSSTLANPTTTAPGAYSVTATAPNGCTASSQVVIAGLNQPSWTLSLGPDLDAEEFEPIFPHPVTDLPVNDWAEVLWVYPDHALGDPCQTCTLPVLKLAESGAVSITLTDPYGCKQSATYQINIQQTSAIYIPNVFAPEGEDGNRIFRIYAGAAARVTQVRAFRIFDRWGNQVHERLGFDPISSDHGWDGTFQGKNAQPGVYVWYAEIEFANGRIKLLKGDVTLSR